MRSSDRTFVTSWSSKAFNVLEQGENTGHAPRGYGNVNVGRCYPRAPPLYRSDPSLRVENFGYGLRPSSVPLLYGLTSTRIEFVETMAPSHSHDASSCRDSTLAFLGAGSTTIIKWRAWDQRGREVDGTERDQHLVRVRVRVRVRISEVDGTERDQHLVEGSG